MKSRSLTSKSKTYHHGNLRESLLDTAVATLKTRDSRELSLRELGRSVGVTAGAPYNHFSCKDELLSELSLRGHRKLLKELDQAVPDPTHPAGQLPAFVRAYLRFGRQHAAYYKVMFLRGIAVEDHATHERPNESSFQLCCAMIQSQIPSLPMEQAVQRTIAVFALLHGLVLLNMEGTLRRSYTEEIEEKSAIDATLRLMTG
jgi:AcrR family transcriptional regulator